MPNSFGRFLVRSSAIVQLNLAAPYQYLFYRVYRYQRKNWPSERATVFVVASFNTLLVFLNLLFLWEILDLAGRPRFSLPALSRLEITGAIAVAGYGQYLFWLHNERYKRVIAQFQAEPDKRSVRRICVVLYIVLTLVLPFGAAAIRGYLQGTL